MYTLPRRLLHTSRAAARAASFHDHDTVIVSAARTPIGAFQSQLASLTAPQLGAVSVRAVLERAGVQGADVNEVLMGNVVSANLGQCPGTQAAFHGGVPVTVPSTVVNKVCSSGLKAVMFGAQSIALGQNHVVLAGGFESMSNIPYYLPKARTGHGYGHGEIIDGCVKDGLWDAFDNHPMGNAGEHCARTYGLSRADQDAYALETYRRAQVAQASGLFKEEIVPVEIVNKKGQKSLVIEDEEPKKLIADKVPTLRPVFQKDGTVTAANASKLNDGSAALLLTSGRFAHERGLKPLAKIRGYADAQRKPIEFTIAPSDAIPRALAAAGLTTKDVDYFEINEAFSSVAMVNMKLLNLDPTRVNAHGGAVALGHPLGASGARILVTLLNVLKQKNATIGAAGICNGGGGASSLVVERLN